VLQLGNSFLTTALQWIGCNNADFNYCFVNMKNIILMLRIKGWVMFFLKKKLHKLSFSVLIFSCLPQGYAETIAVFGDDKHVPVLYLDAHSKPSGALADLLLKISEITGDKYDLHLTSWSRAFERARAGEGAIVGISRNKERQNLFDFSDAIHEENIQMVVRKGKEFSFESLEDLKGKIMGGLVGGRATAPLDLASLDETLDVDLSQQSSVQLNQLLKGEIDVALISGDIEAGPDWVLSGDVYFSQKREEFVVLKPALMNKWLHFAVAKSMGKQAVIERMNLALRALQKKGELKLSLPQKN
jgi:ABC-type amino acid transport substrate-binding protein